MQLPDSLSFLRQTRLWHAVSDRRYLARQRPLRDFYRRFAAPGALVFDIGANVGHYALVFESIGARVLAVEPQAELVRGLRRRFAGRPRIKIVHTALGAAPATAVLHKTATLTEVASLRTDIRDRSRFAAEHAFALTETVPVTTLDRLIAAHGVPAFCKIDVEGFESEVLSGLTGPLPLLSLEFNREFWPETLQCVERLGQLGAYRFNYALAEAPALVSDDWLEPAALIAALAQHPAPLLWGDLYARLA